MPPTEANLLYYFSSLADRHISHKTMKVYLAAITYFSRLVGFNIATSSMHRLHFLLRGIRRSQGGRMTKPPRTPITFAHLHALSAYVAGHYSFQDASMLWAAFTAAFFGLLRSSEFTAPSETTLIQSTLLFRHIGFTSSFTEATLFLPLSKTDPFGTGATVHLFARTAACCPVLVLRRYVPFHPSPAGPLFMFQDGGFLTRSHVAAVLAIAFPNQPNLNTHSFRIGGASALAAAGVPEYIIQSLGRWSSDSFLRYIRLPGSAIRAYQLALHDV